MKVQVAATVADSSRQPVVAELEVEPLALPRRVGRAAKVFLLLLLATVGVFATFIPLVHLFGALALLFVVTPIVTWRAFVRTALSTGAQDIPCPRCETRIAIPAKSAGWPMGAYCPSCAASVRIRPTA
jgi:hypothetical protein